MTETTNQPKLSDVLRGWKIVGSGPTRSGDKYWWPTGLPVARIDQTLGYDVREPGMPVVIRKEKR